MSELHSEKMSSDVSSLATSQSSQFLDQLEVILDKLKTDPLSITADDARLLSGNFAPPDEKAKSSHAQAHHRLLLTAVKELHASVDGSPEEVTTEVLRITQSIVSKMQKALGHTNIPHPEVEGELQEEIAKIEPKIVQGTVTKAEADRLHSLESRAHGHTEKGGITAAAQSVVAKRERQLSSSGGPKTLQPSDSEQSQSDKGSFTSSELQSQHDKEGNLLQAADAVKDKIEEGTLTKEEAGRLQSLESRAHGDTVKGCVAATAQSTAAGRESNAADECPCYECPCADSKNTLSPQEQLCHDKGKNLHQAELPIRPKLQKSTVTEAEANLHQAELPIRPKSRDDSKNTLSLQEQPRHDKEENLRQAELAIRPKIQDGTVTAAEANKLHSCEMRAHGHTEKGRLAATAQSVAAHRQRTFSDISNSPHPSETDAVADKEDTDVDKEPKKVEGDLGGMSKTENKAQ